MWNWIKDKAKGVGGYFWGIGKSILGIEPTIPQFQTNENYEAAMQKLREGTEVSTRVRESSRREESQARRDMQDQLQRVMQENQQQRGQSWEQYQSARQKTLDKAEQQAGGRRILLNKPQTWPADHRRALILFIRLCSNRGNKPFSCRLDSF